MNFMFEPFRKYAQFQGRARRAEYWQFILLYAVAYVLFVILAATGNDGVKIVAGVLFGAYGLAVFVPSLAVGVRRLHDIDRSGWWFLISLIPLVGGIVLLVFNCTEGTRGPNRFGPDPKGLTDEVFA